MSRWDITMISAKVPTTLWIVSSKCELKVATTDLLQDLVYTLKSGTVDITGSLGHGCRNGTGSNSWILLTTFMHRTEVDTGLGSTWHRGTDLAFRVTTTKTGHVPRERHFKCMIANWRLETGIKSISEL